MALFQRDTGSERTIDDMLTPRDVEGADECETVGEEVLDKSTEEDVAAEEVCETKENVADNVLNCFGWKDVKKEKWLVKCANIWYMVASFLWFIFGSLTFAPVIFISNKVDVLFKDKKKSLLCAIVVYAVLIALIVVLIISRNVPQPTVS